MASLAPVSPLALALCGALALAMPTMASAAGYAVTDLGTLGGESTRATRINDRGMVTGESERHDHKGKSGQAFFNWKQKMVGLTRAQAGRGIARGLDVNASGTVVGYQLEPDFISYTYPFIWTRDGFKQLGNKDGSANAINDDGLVAGVADFKAGRHAALWRNGKVQDLGAAGGLPFSEALAMNAAGDVVGVLSDVPDTWFVEHAMVRFDGVMQDLGTFGSATARAVSVNVSRAVVIDAQADEGRIWSALVWQAGVATPIVGMPDAIGVQADAINDAGVVVGSVGRYYDKRNHYHAFVWHDGQMTDLNDLIPHDGDDWVLQEATSINNRGEIVGNGNHGGLDHAFRLTPLP